MRLQNGISDLPRRTPWWPLIRNGLMAVIYPFGHERHNTSYRAERHYMRGPGPKWRAKHARPPTDQPVR
jgi:hypothetical protein